MRFGSLILILIISSAIFAIETHTIFIKQLKRDGLVDITSLDDSIVIDMRYSTENNFIHKDLYGDFNSCFLQKAAAQKLLKAQQELKKIDSHLSLIVYDCLRPRSAQYRMWKLVKGTKMQRYVANPKSGSIHNYGAAVDLSIINTHGTVLDMGTAFDDLSKLSQPRHETYFIKQKKLTNKNIENRKLLRRVMKNAGFRNIKSEWWHFNAFSITYVKKHYSIVE